MTDIFFPCPKCGSNNAEAERVFFGVENGKPFFDFECKKCASVRRLKTQQDPMNLLTKPVQARKI